MKLIYEKSSPGRQGHRFPARDVPAEATLPRKLTRAEDAALPEVSELDVVRHFTKLSQMNFSVDTEFYPLGWRDFPGSIRSFPSFWAGGC